jgi:hypothetical protein
VGQVCTLRTTLLWGEPRLSARESRKVLLENIIKAPGKYHKMFQRPKFKESIGLGFLRYLSGISESDPKSRCCLSVLAVELAHILHRDLIDIVGEIFHRLTRPSSSSVISRVYNFLGV